MAARKLKPHHQDDVRAKIQASQIINRLQAGFNGEVELSSTQVSIAKILLDKTLPNLQSTELSGDVDSPLQINILRYGNDNTAK